jgi:hypothetical protein
VPRVGNPTRQAGDINGEIRERPVDAITRSLTLSQPTVGIMGILVSWHTPDNRWLVDRVYGEGDVDYRVWDEGQLAAELHGPLEVLREYLARFRVDLGDLEPVPEDYDRSQSDR